MGSCGSVHDPTSIAMALKNNFIVEYTHIGPANKMILSLLQEYWLVGKQKLLHASVVLTSRLGHFFLNYIDFHVESFTVLLL